MRICVHVGFRVVGFVSMYHKYVLNKKLIFVVVLVSKVSGWPALAPASYEVVAFGV